MCASHYGHSKIMMAFNHRSQIEESVESLRFVHYMCADVCTFVSHVRFYAVSYMGLRACLCERISVYTVRERVDV